MTSHSARAFLKDLKGIRLGGRDMSHVTTWHSHSYSQASAIGQRSGDQVMVNSSSEAFLVERHSLCQRIPAGARREQAAGQERFAGRRSV